jgi:molybdate transport system substrate-binding protein
MRWLGNALTSALVAMYLSLGPAVATGADVTVFAAASLKEAMDEQGRQFAAATGNKTIVSYGASNALARQIEAGAPADIYISADLDWMDDVDRKHLLAPNTRFNLLRNTLVLIAPSSSGAKLKIGPNFGLAAALGPEKLAMANPDSVPAGKYGKSALEKLGVWTSVEKNVARAENVRAALALVARGEAPFGIVYATDALADRRVKIVDTFPPETYSPILYPAALLLSSTSAAARRLLDYLRSVPARAVWAKYGFGLLSDL